MMMHFVHAHQHVLICTATWDTCGRDALLGGGLHSCDATHLQLIMDLQLIDTLAQV